MLLDTFLLLIKNRIPLLTDEPYYEASGFPEILRGYDVFI